MQIRQLLPSIGVILTATVATTALLSPDDKPTIETPVTLSGGPRGGDVVEWAPDGVDDAKRELMILDDAVYYRVDIEHAVFGGTHTKP